MTLQINDKEQEYWLTIETHVLGKGLRQQDVMALLNEVANSPGVTVNVSARKALIGHVEEHEQVSLLQGAQKGKERKWAGQMGKKKLIKKLKKKKVW